MNNTLIYTMWRYITIFYYYLGQERMTSNGRGYPRITYTHCSGRVTCSGHIRRKSPEINWENSWNPEWVWPGNIDWPATGQQQMEFVFAQLLTDLVREAEAAQTPDNLFVLPEGVLAWKRLFKLLQDEHEIVSMEISDGRQERSREVRPHFNRMARMFEDKGIPFIRVPITASCTHREVSSQRTGGRNLIFRP